MGAVTRWLLRKRIVGQELGSLFLGQAGVLIHGLQDYLTSLQPVLIPLPKLPLLARPLLVGADELRIDHMSKFVIAGIV